MQRLKNEGCEKFIVNRKGEMNKEQEYEIITNFKTKKVSIKDLKTEKRIFNAPVLKAKSNIEFLAVMVLEFDKNNIAENMQKPLVLGLLPPVAWATFMLRMGWNAEPKKEQWQILASVYDLEYEEF